MTEPRDRNQTRQKGFTLVEIMVVIIILGLLATLVAPNVLGMSDEAKRQKAKTDVKQLYEAAKYYKIKNGQYPNSLEDLTEPDDRGEAYIEGLVEDPWGNDYIIREGDRGKIEVVSYGDDGQENTEDDISSTNLGGRKDQ